MKTYTPGLGRRFAVSVIAAVTAIRTTPLHFQKVHGEVRRATVRRFPYGLLFKVESRRIIVLGCMHGKRDPSGWKIRSD